jgi:hypothetical protein
MALWVRSRDVPSAGMKPTNKPLVGAQLNKARLHPRANKPLRRTDRVSHLTYRRGIAVALATGVPRGDLKMPKLNTEGRKRLSSKDFAEPQKRAYPVEDKAHARNAKARASQAVKAGRMSKAEKTKIDKKADAVLKKG